MLPIIFLAMVIIPTIEIALFIQVGSLIGLWPTLLTVVLTAIAGSTLLRIQGLSTMQEAQKAMQDGAVPLEPAIHGVFLIIAGIVLLTPGFLTDAIGLALFIPPVRLWLGRRVFEWVKKHGTVVVMNQNGFAEPPRTPFDEEQPFRQPETVVNLDEDAFQDLAGKQPNPDSPWSGGSNEDENKPRQ